MLAARLRVAAGAAPADPPGTPVVTDPFTRADSTSSLGSAPTGQAWTAHSGKTWGINTNRAYSVVSGDSFATVDTGMTDMDVSATFAVVGGSNPGVVVRYIDANNWCRVIRISTTIRVDWKVAGSETNSGQIGSAGIAVNGAVLRIVVVGTALTAYVNGSNLGGATLPGGLAAATRAGLFANATDTRFDDFAVVTT